MTLSEAVEKLRQSEAVENALILLGDDAEKLRRVALAWPKVPVRVKKEANLKNTPNLYDTLWDAIEINLEKLSQISNTRGETGKLLAILKGYRLIYPDGSLSTIAQKTLRTIVRNELGL